MSLTEGRIDQCPHSPKPTEGVRGEDTCLMSDQNLVKPSSHAVRIHACANVVDIPNRSRVGVRDGCLKNNNLPLTPPESVSAVMKVVGPDSLQTKPPNGGVGGREFDRGAYCSVSSQSETVRGKTYVL